MNTENFCIFDVRPHSFVIVNGGRSSGKTRLVNYFLDSNAHKFVNKYLLSQMVDSLSLLAHHFEKHNIAHAEHSEDMTNNILKTYIPGKNTLIIFDEIDFYYSRQAHFKNLIVKRHLYEITVLVTTQQMNLLDMQYQDYYICGGKQTYDRDVNIFWRKLFGSFMDRNYFEYLYLECTKEFGWLVRDKQKEQVFKIEKKLFVEANIPMYRNVIQQWRQEIIEILPLNHVGKIIDSKHKYYLNPHIGVTFRSGQAERFDRVGLEVMRLECRRYITDKRFLERHLQIEALCVDVTFMFRWKSVNLRNADDCATKDGWIR